MSKRLHKDELPLTFGAFNPVGHVMVGVQSQDHLARAREAFSQAGFEDEDVLEFSPREAHQDMDEMVDKVSPVVSFGYESVLMKRYVQLSQRGYRWLVVYAPDEDDVERLKTVLAQQGIDVAVKYHLLASEDLV
jgi:tRNA A58 N-methylase Trm61